MNQEQTRYPIRKVIQAGIVGLAIQGLTAFAYGEEYEINGKLIIPPGSNLANISIGYENLSHNQTGTGNTAVGSFTLYGNTAGELNTASGHYALRVNNAGSYNTAYGATALENNTYGNHNTAHGMSALHKNISGSNNTAVGYFAGGKTSTGHNNVFIGYQAGDSPAYSDASNQMVIANGPLPGNELIRGDFRTRTILLNGVTRVVGGLVVSGKVNATEYLTHSDARLKKNIQPVTNALQSISQIQGSHYQWNEKEMPELSLPSGNHIGLIAQNVEKVLPQLVREGVAGYKAIAYQELIPVLIEAIKEQQIQIASLQRKQTQLETALVQQLNTPTIPNQQQGIVFQQPKQKPGVVQQLQPKKKSGIVLQFPKKKADIVLQQPKQQSGVVFQQPKQKGMVQQKSTQSFSNQLQSSQTGGSVLAHLDKKDQLIAAESLQRALESLADGRPSKWRSSRTGNSGSATPTRTFHASDGSPCRNYLIQVKAGGRIYKDKGVACRQANGKWKKMN